MSRRMLLEDYSENGLMPVMDGLVCWLDGRDGLTNTDRLGNVVDINVDKIENGNFIVTQRDSIARFIEIIMNSNFDFNNHSFEIVAKRKDPIAHYGRYISYSDNSSYYKIICVGGSPNKSNNKIRYYNFENSNERHINNTNINYEDKFIFYFSFEDKKCFLNGVDDGSGVAISDSKHKDINKIFLFNDFRKLVGNQVIADISSLKIYNRALTEEEIAQNYAYEQSIQRGE